MAAKKTKKSQKPQSAPTASKLNLVALKPLLKTPETPETQTSSPSSVEASLPIETPTSVEVPSSVEPSTSVEAPSSVEASLPVETPTSVETPSSVEASLPVETPTAVAETKKIPKPIKRSPTPPAEIDLSLPENPEAIFQAIGVIAGEVAFSDKKTSVTIADKQYPLFYASTHKKAFEALRIHIKNTGQSRHRLIVYPRVIHFPSREQPYQIAFQLVGFVSDNPTQLEETTQSDSLTIDKQLQDGEFKLSGLWQFIPVCQTPCITVQKNFTDERLTYIKEATVEQKVNFMKASHIPLQWKNAPVRPFRFNPKLEKEKQGNAFFVEIKATFLPLQDVFEFSELCSRPSPKPPRSLKAGKKDKTQALQAKNQRKQEKEKESEERPLSV
jgi:hypothetical protein